MKKIDTFQIIDSSGKAVKAIPRELTKEKLISLYYNMLRLRQFNIKAVNMVRQGRISSFASSLGQEAASIGLAYPLEKKDWLVPGYRDHGSMFVIGVSLYDSLLYWGGNESGSKIPESINCLPPSVPVASQYAHAVGIGLEMKIRGKKNAVVTITGDGGSSEGDWHESINFASVHDLPVVFIVQNNQWAISTPNRLQFKADSVAERAPGYHIPGIRVDGNDVVAVYSVVKDALKRAKSGNGPTLIEALTYRMDDHTTADDAKRYRPEEEIKERAEKDPIDRKS